MQDADDPALPIGLSRLFHNIIRYCISEGDIARLALYRQFMSARFRAHHIVRLFEFSSTEFNIALSSRFIARAFEISLSTQRSHTRRFEGAKIPLGAEGITNL
jgi:hypothetical protein